VTQDALIILCLKVGLVAGFIALTQWVAVYTRLTRRAAWRNPVGRTLIIETLLIAGLFVPQILSLFFNLNRFDSRIAAWCDVALVMLWRTIVWLRMAALGRTSRSGDDDGEAPGGTA